MNKYSYIVSCILGCSLFLSGCNGAGSSTSSPSSPSSNNSLPLTIDPMTTVPVINGSQTRGIIYIYNSSNQVIKNVNYSLGNPTLKSKVKAALGGISGLKLGDLEDVNGLHLINPEACTSIPANGSCGVSFTTPALKVGDLGNSTVRISYKNASGETVTTNQVINYNYTELTALDGVHFTGGLNIADKVGTNHRVVGYLYAGGAAGKSYKNVNLSSNNPATRITAGFINGQEMVAGQVIPVEYEVPIQSDTASNIKVTPNWNGADQASSSSKSLKSVDSGYGAPLTLSLTPQQNIVNYIFGSVPLMTTPASGSVSVTVLNNGNVNSIGGLTARAVGGDSSSLTIDNSDCSGKILQAYAANTCNISFQPTGYNSGTTTVEYVDSSNNVVGSQQVIWTNDKPFPAVYLVPNVNNINFNKDSSSGSIVFSLSNIGNAPLQNINYSNLVSLDGATWVQDSTTCGTSIAPAAVCSITGHLTGTDDGTGTLTLKSTGSYAGNSYSFASLAVRFSVDASASLIMTPASTNWTLLANGINSQSQTYTVSNNGSVEALFNSISLSSMTTNIKPSITGGTCTGTSVLQPAESCSVVVQYGPAPASNSANESGITNLQVSYHGGTPDVDHTVQSVINYNLLGNDSYVQTDVTVNNLNGNGTSNDPYVGNATLSNMLVSITYTNKSTNYAMKGFYLNTQSLPFGLDAASNCPTILESGASCKIDLSVNKTNLKQSSQSVVLNFAIPTPSWTTPLGFYTQPMSTIYLNYSQPSIVMSLSNNSGSFESTILNIAGTGIVSGSPVTLNVAGVSQWLESSPTDPSSNCTVNGSSYAVQCTLSLSGSTNGSVKYIMPNYLPSGESATIPLVFSTPDIANLSPTYTFINYVK